jgi:hypothetical protein
LARHPARHTLNVRAFTPIDHHSLRAATESNQPVSRTGDSPTLVNSQFGTLAQPDHMGEAGRS